jgi:hypothetical protein
MITLVVVVAAGLFSYAALSPKKSTGSPGIGTGLGTNDASGDVTLGSCHDGGPGARDLVTCTVSIVNHSDGTSDYYIEGQAEEGGTIVGGVINAVVNAVPPGGNATAKLSGVVDGRWSGVRIIEVQRTASG